MAHTALHAAAYVLDPEFHKHKHEDGGEVMNGFHTMVRKFLPDDTKRANALVSYEDYVNKQGVFADNMMWTKAKELAPWKWWSTFAR